MPLPILYVEGKSDVSVISALLKRHGIDTKQGQRHLIIKDQGNVETLLSNMSDAIRAATDRPIGFVLDIDIETRHRWAAVRQRLVHAGVLASESHDLTCPPDGFIGRVPDYPFPCGVWLMPDCQSDGQMLEHLIQTLLPANHPLWPHAQTSTAVAATLVDQANASHSGERRWMRFADSARIKAEIRTWLAWQSEPGVQLGAAINDQYLGHDSPQAVAFLGWMSRLFQFV